jgi:general secretion pathway protein C
MNHNHSMLARLAAFLVWALVAASVVFWGLRMLVRAPSAPPHSIAVTSAAAVQGDLTRLLGAAPVSAAAAAVAPEAASRFRLHGVMAPKGKAEGQHSGQGVALIAVDGKPARAFAIGSRLDRDLVLQSVSLRSASIGPAEGGAGIKLELPPLALPATGTLPSLGGAVPLSPTPPATAPSPSLPPHSMVPKRTQGNSR